MNDSKTTFRASAGWILIFIGISLIFFGLAVVSVIQWHLRGLSTGFFCLSALGLGLSRHALKVPLFIFRGQGLSYRRFLFSPPRYLPFEMIREVHPTDSDHRVVLILTDGSQTHLSLCSLSRQDRIRFIFLLESDVNRKHIA